MATKYERITLTAELFNKLKKLLLHISKNRQLNVQEQQEAKLLLFEVEKEVAPEHKGKYRILPKQLTINVLRLLMKLITSDLTSNIILEILKQVRR